MSGIRRMFFCTLTSLLIMGSLSLILVTPLEAKGQQNPQEVPTYVDTFELRFLEIGLKGGVNLGNVYGADESQMDYKVGFLAGVHFSFNLLEFLAIQPEVLFIQKGAEAAGATWEGTLEDKYKLSYLEFPLLLRFNLDPLDKVNAMIMAGGYYSVKLSGSYSQEMNGVLDYETSALFKGHDLGLIFGLGAAYALRFPLQGRILIEVRYDLGLTSIHEYWDIKTRTLSMLVGYTF